MTMTADEPVGSGQTYAVIEVDGHRPSSLDDFVAESTITVVRGNERHRVMGAGTPSDRGIRFHQKDLETGGRDVRVWAIEQDADETFSAEPIGAF
jgi:hypothetical protein